MKQEYTKETKNENTPNAQFPNGQKKLNKDDDSSREQSDRDTDYEKSKMHPNQNKREVEKTSGSKI